MKDSRKLEIENEALKLQVETLRRKLEEKESRRSDFSEASSIPSPFATVAAPKKKK